MAVASELVVKAVNASSIDGCVSSATFDRIIREHNLPARQYGDVQRLIADAGVQIVQSVDHDAAADDEEEEDAQGWDGDGFGLFLFRTRHRVLTTDEECELGKRIEAGNLARRALDRPEAALLSPEGRRELRQRVSDGEHARDEFARCNVRLVVKIASRFQGRGLPLEDLVQEGWFGLARAVDKFDYRRGHKFSTYATWWIRQTVRRAIDEIGQTIRVPVHAAEELRRLKGIRSELQTELRRVPTIREISIAAGVSEPTARKLLRYESPPRSLDALLSDRRSSMLDILPDLCFPDPAEAAERAADIALLRRLLAGLKDRECQVLIYRYGLDGSGRRRTLDEIGTMFGLTRERIRQIENRATSRLQAIAATQRRDP